MIGMAFTCGYENCSNHDIVRVILEEVERDPETGDPVLDDHGQPTVVPVPAGDIRRRCEGSVTVEEEIDGELTHTARQCFRPLDRLPNGLGGDREHVDAEMPEPDETEAEAPSSQPQLGDLIAAGVAAAVQAMLPDTATAKQKSDAYDKASQAATDAVAAAQDEGL